MKGTTWLFTRGQLITFCCVLLMFFGGCSRSNVESPADFTREFVAELHKANPKVKVTVVKDLELKLLFPNSTNAFSSFLDNAYDIYKHDPTSKADVLARYVKANLNSVRDINERVDVSRVVPIIKDRPWLDEIAKTVADRENKKPFELVYEELNPDLVIVYAQDSPENIRYLVPKDLEDAKIKKTELRSLACTNLQRMLPEVQSEGANGFYMLTAGSDYNPSLLLLDHVWKDMQSKVKGDVLVAVPCREILIVTGSQTPNAPANLKKIASKAYAGSAYRITDKLFIYRNGKFSEWKE
jgi:uncharacterized protein YtpQ (UPF0354 family)